MLVSFVNDCLVKGKTDFFTHLKRLISTIGLKKTKKIWKAVLVMQEDKQAFGIMLGERSEPKRSVSVPLLHQCH